MLTLFAFLLPTDLPVVTVLASDADDVTEGTNALVTYTIEKNVVDEASVRGIFSVDPHSVVVTTAVCCLDRETTPSYLILVTATDGGGLKGEYIHISPGDLCSNGAFRKLIAIVMNHIANES